MPHSLRIRCQGDEGPRLNAALRERAAAHIAADMSMTYSQGEQTIELVTDNPTLVHSIIQLVAPGARVEVRTG